MSGWTVPWRIRTQAILPTNGSAVILKAWPTKGLPGSGATGTAAASSPGAWRTGRPGSWPGEGKYLTTASMNSLTPISPRAAMNSTGMTVPVIIAAAKAPASFSGAIALPPRYAAISSSSASTMLSSNRV